MQGGSWGCAPLKIPDRALPDCGGEGFWAVGACCVFVSWPCWMEARVRRAHRKVKLRARRHNNGALCDDDVTSYASPLCFLSSPANAVINAACAASGLFCA